MRFFYIFTFFLLFLTSNSNAQHQQWVAESQPFNEQKWEKETKELDYNKQETRSMLESEQKRFNIKDNLKKEKEKTETTKKDDLDISNFDFFSGGILKFLSILIGIILIAVLVYYFVGGMGRSDKLLEKEKLLSQVEGIEENLPQADVETPLGKAIKMKEYKIATRLCYLYIIQQLALQNHIKWRKDKTNRAYCNETRSRGYFSSFFAMTTAYEKAWFGEKETEEGEFQATYAVFEELKKKLS